MLQLLVRQTPVRLSALGLTMVREWRDHAGEVCAHSYVGSDESWIAWSHVAFRFRDDGPVEAFPDRPVHSQALSDFFTRIVEPLILQARGYETLHASAVSTPAGLVAFCGESGCGKSTIAYALDRLGHPQRADDAVVLEFGPAGASALSLPFGVRLRPQSAEHFGFSASPRPLQDVLPLVRPDRDSPRSEPIAALFVLSRSPEGAPVVTPLSASEAFRALLPHARCFDGRSMSVRHRVLKHYLEVCSAVPVFSLRFSEGLGTLAEVLESIQRRLGLRTLTPA